MKTQKPSSLKERIDYREPNFSFPRQVRLSLFNVIILRQPCRFSKGKALNPLAREKAKRQWRVVTYNKSEQAKAEDFRTNKIA
jgi:hypothetical protein